MADFLPDYDDPDPRYHGIQLPREPDDLPRKPDDLPRGPDDLAYIDVLSSDGVSTITGPLNHEDFDPVGTYIKPEEDTILEVDDCDHPYFDDENHGQDFDPHGVGPGNSDTTQPTSATSGPPRNQKFAQSEETVGKLTESEENIRDEYAGRLEGWYNQMEQLAVQHDSGSFIESGKSRPSSEQKMSSVTLEGDDRPPFKPSASSGVHSPARLPQRPSSVPPRRGSARPPRGSVPPRPGSAPPRPGSAPPRPGSAPPRPGSAPPRPGSAPPPPKAPAIKTRPRNRKQTLLIYLIIFLVLILILLGVGMVAVVFFSDLLPFGPNADDDDETGESEPSTQPTLSPMEPTLYPMESTPLPTDPPAPTQIPTLGEKQLETELVVVRSFDGPEGFGLSVARSADFVAIGSSSGDVSIFVSNNGGGTWEDMPVFSGPPNSAFGFDVAFADLFTEDNTNAEVFLIGSPQHGSDAQGAVYLYLYDTNTSLWQMQGEPFLGSNASTENFGYSVAVSQTTSQAVVGAPGFNSGAGCVYIFFLSESNDGVAFEIKPNFTDQISGLNSNSRFGAAVDISPDGSALAVGEPGQNTFLIYSWAGGDWKNTFSHLSPSNTTEFGSSVVFLSERFVAVGDPGFDNNRGEIQVFEKSEEGNDWTALSSIRGNEGDRLGAFRSVSGQEGSDLQVVVGTSNGALKSYDWMGDSWAQRIFLSSGDAVSSVVSFTEADGSFTVLAGFTNVSSAVLYEEVSSSSPNLVTSAPPTISPTLTMSLKPTNLLTSAPSTFRPTSTMTTKPTVPLASPTSFPITTPPSLTSARPSFSPSGRKEWSLVAGPLNSSLQDSLFGFAVALADDFLLVGGPGPSQIDNLIAGNVTSFQRSTAWDVVDFNTSLDAVSFGYSLDAAIVSGKLSVVVGAINTNDGAETSRYGSAHYFEYGSQGWIEIGGIMQPFMQVTETGGEFGSSVALAAGVQRVVVGAKSSSVNNDLIDCGRVYTFQLVNGSWDYVTSIAGERSSMFLGASMDITSDGSKLLVGAPLDLEGDGSVYLYEWKDPEWILIYAWLGQNASLEGLGTQVAFLTDDGMAVALGAPNYNVDQGTIRVYEAVESSFEEAANIIGFSGERIGKTLSVASGRIGYGTDIGSFYVVQEASYGWELVASAPPISSESPVVSISISADANIAAVGFESEEVFVFELTLP